MATANNKFCEWPAPFRLAGTLAAGTVVTTGTSPQERVYTTGFASVTFRYKAASITGTCTANIHPMLSDAVPDDTVGTRAVTGLPTAVTGAPTTEQVISYTLKGEQYVEIELALSAGGSDTMTLSYVDCFLVPL